MAPRSGSCACHLKEEGRVTKVHTPRDDHLETTPPLHRIGLRKSTPGMLQWGGA
jgi:hypothetical protein